MQLSGKKYKRIAVKVGSSLLYSVKKGPEEAFIEQLVRELSSLIKSGIEPILVSSGAIACGMHVLKLDARPKDLSTLQAAAALGQHILMSYYRKFLIKNNLECAQILLTWDDFSDRRRYLNAKNTLLKLLELKTLPIINENDTVATDEIKFGDNDRLSALVASLVSADLLVILSDVEGLLDKHKKVIRAVDKITPQIKSFACSTDKKACVGGMITKIEAAEIAMDSGIPCVIANGLEKNILSSVLINPEASGTVFIPKKVLGARDRWIAFGSKPKGKVGVDEGAKKALFNRKSLLSVGVVAVSGEFYCGDIISIMDKENTEFARGKAGLSSRQLDKVKGSRSEKEVIHCDNIVILRGSINGPETKT